MLSGNVKTVIKNSLRTNASLKENTVLMTLIMKHYQEERLCLRTLDKFAFITSTTKKWTRKKYGGTTWPPFTRNATVQSIFNAPNLHIKKLVLIS